MLNVNQNLTIIVAFFFFFHMVLSVKEVTLLPDLVTKLSSLHIGIRVGEITA